MVTGYRAHHRTLLPVQYINLKSNAINNPFTQIIQPATRLGVKLGHLGYCYQVVHTYRDATISGMTGCMSTEID